MAVDQVFARKLVVTSIVASAVGLAAALAIPGDEKGDANYLRILGMGLSLALPWSAWGILLASVTQKRGWSRKKSMAVVGLTVALPGLALMAVGWHLKHGTVLPLGFLIFGSAEFLMMICGKLAFPPGLQLEPGAAGAPERPAASPEQAVPAMEGLAYFDAARTDASLTLTIRAWYPLCLACLGVFGAAGMAWVTMVTYQHGPKVKAALTGAMAVILVRLAYSAVKLLLRPTIVLLDRSRNKLVVEGKPIVELDQIATVGVPQTTGTRWVTASTKGGALHRMCVAHSKSEEKWLLALFSQFLGVPVSKGGEE